MARVFNLREGFTKNDDILPDRFFEPQTSGELSNTKLDRLKFSEAIEKYYYLMGWSDAGIPTEIKLESLDVSWINQYLSK
jgi:aldehyde:ferredoxin oxidoreductase